MICELRLNKSVDKEFVVTTTKQQTSIVEVEVESVDGIKDIELKEKTFTEKKDLIITSKANTIRITALAVDKCRLTLRYSYGDLNNGKFEACAKDEGLVINGRACSIYGIHQNYTEEEAYQLLKKFLKLNGRVCERGKYA